jgi:hypothetical protein
MPKKGKRPALMLYTGDILKDEQLGQCSPATRGIWFDVLCHIHDGDRGELAGTLDGLARICRCSPEEMRTAISELKDTEAGTVTERNEKITLVCRRMAREHKERKSGAGRQLQYRQKHKPDESRDSDAKVTPPSSSSSSSAFSTSDKDPPSPPESGGDQGQLFKVDPPAKPKLRDVASWWNDLAGEHGLKTVQGWDADDDKKVRARLKQFRDPGWFETIETETRILSDFGKGFVTIRWLYEPRNFKKLLSGDYRDEKATRAAAKGEAVKSSQQKALADMKRWRGGAADSADVAKYKKRLAMYRTRDSLGQLPAENVWILEQLGEALDA